MTLIKPNGDALSEDAQGSLMITGTIAFGLWGIGGVQMGRNGYALLSDAGLCVFCVRTTGEE